MFHWSNRPPPPTIQPRKPQPPIADSDTVIIRPRPREPTNKPPVVSPAPTTSQPSMPRSVHTVKPGPHQSATPVTYFRSARAVRKRRRHNSAEDFNLQNIPRSTSCSLFLKPLETESQSSAPIVTNGVVVMDCDGSVAAGNSALPHGPQVSPPNHHGSDYWVTFELVI